MSDDAFFNWTVDRWSLSRSGNPIWLLASREKRSYQKNVGIRFNRVGTEDTSITYRTIKSQYWKLWDTKHLNLLNLTRLKKNKKIEATKIDTFWWASRTPKLYKIRTEIVKERKSTAKTVSIEEKQLIW